MTRRARGFGARGSEVIPWKTTWSVLMPGYFHGRGQRIKNNPAMLQVFNLNADCEAGEPFCLFWNEHPDSTMMAIV